MLAFIKKKRNEDEWITGYCGSAPEIILQFLNAGVRDLYQRVWLATSGNVGDAAQFLNELQKRGGEATATRQDVEGIAFDLGGMEYQCIGCAETHEEAQALCDTLEAINECNNCTSSYRLKWYSKFIELARNRYPDVADQEMREILAAAKNLKL